MYEVYDTEPASIVVADQKQGPQGDVTPEAVAAMEAAKQFAEDSARSAEDSKRYAEDSARSAEESKYYSEESARYAENSAESAADAKNTLNILKLLLFFDIDEKGDIMPKEKEITGGNIIRSKSFIITFGDLYGITVIKGAWNREMRRVEC